ncbi:MAG: hypothetical protein WBX15_11810 [Thermoanaerobaculia bacterium]
MTEREISRQLPERTGRHHCISCLQEVPGEEYFANDFLCNGCAEKAGHFPLSSTPCDLPQPERSGGTGAK